MTILSLFFVFLIITEYACRLLVILEKKVHRGFYFCIVVAPRPPFRSHPLLPEPKSDVF
jgi:hypothetical protein